MIPFGAMVQYHPISAKDLSRLHKFGKRVLPRIFLRYALFGGGGKFGKGDTMIADIEELEEMGRIRNSSSENQCGRSIDIIKERRVHIPSSRCYSKIVTKRQRFPEKPLQGENEP